MVIWLLAGSLLALADGVVIPQIAFPKPTIPDQQALIDYADGTERLVVETSLTGAGTKFAWLVPLPSPPKVEAVSRGVFPTLQTIFQPRLRHDVPPYYLGFIMVASLAFLMRREAFSWKSCWADLIAWLLLACVLAADAVNRAHPPIIAIPLLMMVVLVARAKGSRLGVLFGFLLAFLASWMTPAVLSAGGGSTAVPADSVHIFEGQTAGVYETVTLSADRADDLLNWLNVHGFAMPTNLAPVVKDYLAQHWVFVAAKVRRDNDHGTTLLHPLAFAFKTDKPVYPLRLTGIENGPCQVDLYVFGPSEAMVQGFAVVCCRKPTYPGQDLVGLGPGNAMRITHPGLRQLVTAAPVATKLTGKLSPLEMQKDGRITWVPFHEKNPVVYSHRGASIFTANIFVSLAVLVLAAKGLVKRFRPGAPKHAGIWLACLASVAGGALWTYAALPKTEVLLTNRVLLSVIQHRQTKEAADFLHGQFRGEGSTNQIEAARSLMRQYYHQDLRNYWRENIFTGAPMREEDSPGNYIIRPCKSGLEYVWHDIAGAEEVYPPN